MTGGPRTEIVTVRPMRDDDRPSVNRLIRAAFDPEDVVTFLEALRSDGCLLGEWVAEQDGKIVGHVAFSRAHVKNRDGRDHPVAMLTPLAVLPERQSAGIGTQLMEETIGLLEEAGERVFAVLGHPDYYPRVGFSAERAHGIESPWPGNPAFMVRGAAIPDGKLVLPPAIENAC